MQPYLIRPLKTNSEQINRREEHATLSSQTETETLFQSIKQHILKKFFYFQKAFQFLFWLNVGDSPANLLRVKLNFKI